MKWVEKDNKLSFDFQFSTFVEAWTFMTEVAIHAEKQNHHPDWSNIYNKVSINLSTHDAGNTVTPKDYKLAETISKIYTKYQ